MLRNVARGPPPLKNMTSPELTPVLTRRLPMFGGILVSTSNFEVTLAVAPRSSQSARTTLKLVATTITLWLVM
jgi:hypothetical protein